MKITLTDESIANKTEFKPGARGYFVTEDNPLTFIGEDDLHVWTILDNGGMYYGVFKQPENLAALHVTSSPVHND